MTPNDLIAGGYRMSKALLHRMTDDLSPADFRHVPCPGANSAAWVLGHLAVTLRRTAERLGTTGLPPVPADFAARFTATGQAAGEQPDLGDPAELVRQFDAAADAVITAVRTVPAQTLDGPPVGPVKLANTFGEALLFGSAHVAMHAGQLSTVRRSLGKPPVV
jgi:hypothetical protein